MYYYKALKLQNVVWFEIAHFFEVDFDGRPLDSLIWKPQWLDGFRPSFGPLCIKLLRVEKLGLAFMKSALKKDEAKKATKPDALTTQ